MRSSDAAARIAPLARDVETACATANALDAETIHPSIAGLAAFSSPGALEAYTVNAWTARTWLDARTARRYGADGLIADYPGLAVFEGDPERPA